MYHKEDLVSFLYISKESNSIYFEENVEVSNGPYEKYMASNKGFYYFLNPGGRIQCVHIPEQFVFSRNSKEYKTAKILYGKK